MYDASMSLLAVVTMALAAYGVGRVALRALRTDADDPLEIAVWSLALGLVLVGLLLAALGLVGLLQRSLVGVFTLAAGFWGIGELLRAHAALAQRQPSAQAHGSLAEQAVGPAHVSNWAIRCVWALAAMVVTCRLLSALAPPTDGAALRSQLEIPKTWLVEGSLVYLPANGDTRLVPPAALWRVWALALDGGVAAQLSDWALGLLLALATVVLGRPIVGRRAAWIAGAAVLLVPAVTHDMALARDGLATAVLATLSLAAWRRGTVEDDSPRWFAVAGLLLAGLLDGSVVSLALLASFALASAALLWRSGTRCSRLPRGYAMMVAAAALAAAPLLVRAVECGRTTQPEIIAATQHEHADELLRDAGFVFLVAAPGILIARRLRGLGLLLAMAGCFGLFVTWLSPTGLLPILLPMVPLLAVALAWVWCEWRRLPRPARLVAHATLLLVFMAGASAAVLEARSRWQVALGAETRQQYLLDREPTYKAASLLNQLGAPHAHLLSQDAGGFYFNCRVTPADAWRQTIDGAATEPNLLPDDCARLRDAGFTHVLLVAPAADAEPADSMHGDVIATRPLAVDPIGMIRLHEYVFRCDDGTARRYGLYMLR